MKFKFTAGHIAEIEKVLETSFTHRGNQYRAVLENKEDKRKPDQHIYLKYAHTTALLFRLCCQ